MSMAPLKDAQRPLTMTTSLIAVTGCLKLGRETAWCGLQRYRMVVANAKAAKRLLVWERKEKQRGRRGLV